MLINRIGSIAADYRKHRFLDDGRAMARRIRVLEQKYFPCLP